MVRLFVEWLREKKLSLIRFLNNNNRNLINRGETYVALAILIIKIVASFAIFIIWGEETVGVFMSQLGVIFILAVILYLKNPHKFEFYVDRGVAKLFKYTLFVRCFSVPFIVFYVINYARYKPIKEFKAGTTRNLFRLLYYICAVIFIGFLPIYILIFFPRFFILAYGLMFVTLPKFVMKGVDFNSHYLILNTEVIRNLFDYREVANTEIFLSPKFMKMPRRIRYVYYHLYYLANHNLSCMPLFFLLFSLFKKYSDVDELSVVLDKGFTKNFICRIRLYFLSSNRNEYFFKDIPPISETQVLAMGGIFNFLRQLGPAGTASAVSAAATATTWAVLKMKDAEYREEQRKKDDERAEEQRKKDAEHREEQRIKDDERRQKHMSDEDKAYERREEQHQRHIKELKEVKGNSLDEYASSTINNASGDTNPFPPRFNNAAINRSTQKNVDEMFKDAKKTSDELRNATQGIQKHPSVMEEEYSIFNLVAHFFNFLIKLLISSLGF